MPSHGEFFGVWRRPDGEFAPVHTSLRTNDDGVYLVIVETRGRPPALWVADSPESSAYFDWLMDTFAPSEVAGD